MHQVNDDMDELYKRAAEDYPLNTAGADWDAVLKKIEASGASSSKNKNYKHLLWLLLLLPLGLLYKNYYRDDKPVLLTSKNISNKNSTDPALSNSKGPVTNFTQKDVETIDKPLIPLKYASVFDLKRKGKVNSIITQGNSETVLPERSITGNTSRDNSTPKNEGKIVGDVNNYTDQNNNEKIATPDLKEEPAINDKDKPVNNGSKKTPGKQERGLYAGIIISPDISTIKFQSVKNIGVSLGVAIGYQVDKRISVESGVSWSVKNYYSEGKNFSTGNIRMPAGAKIKSVAGDCNMIEVPLTVNYDFKPGVKKNLSVSAGVSSYFMKKESYVYEVERNGQQYPYAATYQNTSNHFFAVANVAVGYNRKIKNNVSIRVGPYLKIPLKGVGVGNLPIMSTGLNIGIIKKLTR